MTARLWLVRHGETDWSAEGRLSGWTDVDLNERGRAQALGLRERLAGRTFASVWSSDLRRAEETARLAYGAALIDRRLRELDFGDLDGACWDQVSADHQAGLSGFDDFAAPDGESVEAFRRRVLDFVGSLGAGRHLVFTHGGVIRLLLRMTDADRHVGPGEIAIVSTRAIDLGTPPRARRSEFSC